MIEKIKALLVLFRAEKDFYIVYNNKNLFYIRIDDTSNGLPHYFLFENSKQFEIEYWKNRIYYNEKF